MDIKTALKKARDLIDTPEHWTRNAYARDANGTSTLPCGPAATCWCVMGAVERVAGDNWLLQVALLQRLRQALPGFNSSLAAFNDTNAHADVLQLIDRAMVQ